MAAQYDSSQIRSVQIRRVGLVGHGGCGATALAEAVLLRSGTTCGLARIVNRASILDVSSEKLRRPGGIRIHRARLGHDVWRGHRHHGAVQR